MWGAGITWGVGTLWLRAAPPSKTLPSGASMDVFASTDVMRDATRSNFAGGFRRTEEGTLEGRRRTREEDESESPDTVARFEMNGCTTLGALPCTTSQFENNYFTEMCSGSEAGSYLRLIDFCITQL